MKKLIYSQEDVDLMVSIETQQYQEKLEYEHYCNEQLRNKITNLEYKIKRLEDNKYKEVLDKIKEELKEADEAVEYWQKECDKKSKVLDKIKEYIKVNMEEYGGDIYLVCAEIEKILEEIE